MECSRRYSGYKSFYAKLHKNYITVDNCKGVKIIKYVEFLFCRVTAILHMG